MEINEPNQPTGIQPSILTQNFNKAERKLKLRWILAITSLPLFGIYAAFGIAPQTLYENIPTTTVIEEVALPDINEVIASNTLDEPSTQNYWYKDHVRRDDTLNSLLARLNIRNRDAIQYLRSNEVASEIANSLIPGRNIAAETDGDGNLVSLEYQLSADAYIHIAQTPAGYEAKKTTHELEVRPILKSATIQSSLFGATDSAGIPDRIAIQLADMFESDIDFHKDLRRNDYFNVIYEGSYDQGELFKTGDVLAAEFVNKGKIYRAIGYRDDNGQMQYYTPEGNSLHKSFLRSPLEFTRVSSGFNLGRFHPVLQRVRAHKGVDMAAPTGTRVKASGDAVVNFAGKKGGYGNVIILKHANGISTVYGHLSRFASGLRRGNQVTQGQVIGYVGMTGVATGPHLHYEFLLNGKHRDPMKVALPKANPIKAHQKVAFDNISSQLTAQLKLLGASNIAALE